MPPREVAHQLPIFALVDEEACLLPLAKVNHQSVAAFVDFPFCGLDAIDVAVGIAILRAVVVDEALIKYAYKVCPQFLPKEIGQQRQRAMHPRAMSLQDQHPVVPISHQSWQPVALGMHHTEHVAALPALCPALRGETQLPPIGYGGADTPAVEIGIHLCRGKRKHLADDGFWLIVPHGKPVSTRIYHVDHIALLRLPFHAAHRPAEEPRMPTLQGLFLARGYY